MRNRKYIHKENICKICKKTFHPRYNNPNQKHCSVKCSSVTKEKENPFSLRTKGNKNVNWNGGVSEYPNHILMKKNRLVKLQQAGGKCEICGKKADRIHHRDEAKNNHALDNLICVCTRCHGVLHRGRNCKTSKFIRLYGLTIGNLAVKYNISPQYIYKLHLKNELSNFMQRGN